MKLWKRLQWGKLTQATGIEAKPASYNDLSFYNQVNQGQSGDVIKTYYTNGGQTEIPSGSSRFIPKGTDSVKYFTTNSTIPFHTININSQQREIINKKHN